MAELFLLDRSGRTRRFPIGPQPAGVGRAPSNPIFLEDRCISAFHAEIVPSRTGAGHVLRDLGSLNATRVNGAVISEVPLSPFEVLYLGDLLAVFVDTHRILDCSRLPRASLDAPPGADGHSQGRPGSLFFAPRIITSWWGPVPRILLFMGPSGECLLFPTAKEKVSVGPSDENDVIIRDRELVDFDMVLKRDPDRNTWLIEPLPGVLRQGLLAKHRVFHQRFNDVEMIDLGGLRCWLKSGGATVEAPAPSVNAPSGDMPAHANWERIKAMATSKGERSAESPPPSISFTIPGTSDVSSSARGGRTRNGAKLAPPPGEPAPKLKQALERPSGTPASSRSRKGSPSQDGRQEAMATGGQTEAPDTKALLEEKAATISKLRGELRETTEALWRMKKEKNDAARAKAMELIQRENQLIETLRREKASLYNLLDP